MKRQHDLQRRRFRSTPFFALAATLTALTGCEDRPPTNTDEILYYVRNGDIGAKVRRLDPPAQEYVDNIFQAYRKWEDACAPIQELADLDALWPKDSSEWRDANAVGEKLAAIADWKADERKTGDDVTRAESLEHLDDAVEDVPDVPVGDVADLAAAVREQLAVETRRAWLTQIADLYESLYAMALEKADAFDANADGLAFQMAEGNDRAERSWNELHTLLEDARENMIAGIEHTLTVEMEERDKAVVEKQKMRSAGVTTEAEHRRFRQLEMLLHYYDQRKVAAEARQRELAANDGA